VVLIMAGANIIQVYDQNKNRLAFLQNAFNIGYHKKINALWSADFSLPSEDPKNDYCKPFNYVELFDGTERVELFRIVGADLTRSTNAVTVYQCEHVLATLMDDVLFQYHQIGNTGVFTKAVIRYILDRQTEHNWQLGICDFNRQFEYKWENENLLAALFSVARPFMERIIWSWNTRKYPWTIHLQTLGDEIKSEIRYAKNLTEITKTVDATSVITRLYCLGYGEGDNQLDIRSVNNGIPYLDAPTMTTWGHKASILVDRRFENAEALKAHGQRILNNAGNPFVSYEASALDLFSITGQRFDKYEVGDMVRIIDPIDNINETFPIAEIEKTDITGSPADIRITIANKSKDLAGSINELQNRALINDLYAQGATNQVMVNFADNADRDNPALLQLYIPDTMVRVNSCVLRLEFEAFRAFSRGIESTEQQVITTTTSNQIAPTTSTTAVQTPTTTSTQQTAQTTTSTQQVSQTTTSTQQTSQTTTSGGGTTATSSSGGGTTTTSGSGGGTTTTSQAGGGQQISATYQLLSDFGIDSVSTGGNPPHTHLMPNFAMIGNIQPHTHQISIQAHTHSITVPNHTHSVSIPNHSHSITIPSHSHSVTIPGHNHSVTIPGHNHTVTIPGHNHTVTIPGHSHSVTIPPHTHRMEFGIFRTGGASVGRLHINGRYVQDVHPSMNIDIANMLADSRGRIARNTFHMIEIFPVATNNNPLALTRIVASIFLQIFTNSRGRGDF